MLTIILENLLSSNAILTLHTHHAQNSYSTKKHKQRTHLVYALIVQTISFGSSALLFSFEHKLLSRSVLQNHGPLGCFVYVVSSNEHITHDGMLVNTRLRNA
jgi:hypothetical protein